MAILGALIGDTVGSRFEFKGNRTKSKDFELITDESVFTDDTVLTIATADCILHDPTLNYTKYYQDWAVKYPTAGWGGYFMEWMYLAKPYPYNSFGNGSAMRVSPVGYAYDSVLEVLVNASKSAEVTHNHPEGIKGAQATATAIFLARQGKSKQEIKDYITQTFNYNLDFTIDEIRPTYKFDVTCQGSVPQAIVAFLESSDFENAIRLAISIGGDSDTIACITGGIASAFYKLIPTEIMDFVVDKLPSEYIEIMNKFDEHYDRK